MRAERIWLDDPAPIGIERNHSLLTDALAPVIFIGEAAAGPTNVWDLNCFKRSYNVVADAAGIGDLGIRSDPHAFVNTVAQVFGKLTKDVAIDFGAGLCDLDRDLHLFLGWHWQSD